MPIERDGAQSRLGPEILSGAADEVRDEAEKRNSQKLQNSVRAGWSGRAIRVQFGNIGPAVKRDFRAASADAEGGRKRLVGSREKKLDANHMLAVAYG